MRRIIIGGKTTNLYKNNSDKIGFRGELYDYVLTILVTLFVLGFFILQYS